MKTKEQLQTAINEILAVCKKHGVLLVGTCSSEGIYGEITVGDIEGLMASWSFLDNVNYNQIQEDSPYNFTVGGIGEF